MKAVSLDREKYKTKNRKEGLRENLQAFWHLAERVIPKGLAAVTELPNPGERREGSERIRKY